MPTDARPAYPRAHPMASTRALFLHPLALALAGTLVLTRCSDSSPGPVSPTDGGMSAGTDGGGPVAMMPDRAPGQRAPRSAACDPADPIRCLLPWPSDVFTVRDGSTATGIHLNLHADKLSPGDDPTGANLADGFSRATPVLTAFPHPLDTATLGDGTTAAVRLVVSEPGTDFGTLVPVRVAIVGPMDDAVGLEAYPRRPLRAASEHVAVVLDQLHTTDGTTLAPGDDTRVALGLRPPRTADEESLRAYHAPTRAALARAGVDPAHVLRVWTFTTRSQEQPTRVLRAMRQAGLAAVAAGHTSVAIDDVQIPASGTVAAVVLGRLTGLPNFIGTDGRILRAADGSPMAAAMPHDARFRVAIPQGTGGYPIVMYGHGTGGEVTDSAFDGPITSEGLAKVGLEFRGWTGGDLPNTFGNFAHMLLGVEQSTALLAQSLSDGMAVLAALGTADAMGHTPLADLLAGPMLGTHVNPAAGRRADATRVVWAGGSLGGTLGFVYACAEPTVRAAVINVPGAGWSQFVTGSTIFTIARLALRVGYPTDLDTWLAVAQSQGNWDDVDGGAWFDSAGTRPFLLQESIGDPVLPNIGTEFAAAALGATQVGAILVPVTGAPHADVATGHTALTQYHVPVGVTMPLEVHGFADRATPAGVAAREQLTAFLRSVLAGMPTIGIPPTCQMNTPAGSCDFSSR